MEAAKPGTVQLKVCQICKVEVDSKTLKRHEKAHLK